jgi:hypothetical protein
MAVIKWFVKAQGHTVTFMTIVFNTPGIEVIEAINP